MRPTLTATKARAVAAEHFQGPKLARVLELIEQAEADAVSRPLHNLDRRFEALHRCQTPAVGMFSLPDLRGDYLGKHPAEFEAFAEVRLPAERTDVALHLVANALETELVDSSQAIHRVRKGSDRRHGGAVALVAAGAFATFDEAIAFLRTVLPHAA